MLNKKSIVIATVCFLMVLAGYMTTLYGFGEKCLYSIDAIGCMQFGEKCLMFCQISIDKSHYDNADVPILVAKDHGTGTVTVIEEMNYIGTRGDCAEYDCRPEVPCEIPYDVAIYINDISGEPILSALVACPQ